MHATSCFDVLFDDPGRNSKCPAMLMDNISEKTRRENAGPLQGKWGLSKLPSHEANGEMVEKF